jgi:hypothetical protein
VGKRADLVFLEKHPLENISHTRTITGVMVLGKWMSQADIQKGLDDVAEYNKTFKK